MARLREIREQHGYTQEFVADSIDVSRLTYIRSETGDRYLNSNELLKLAKLYDVSIDYLLGLSNVPVICFDTKNDPSPSEREQAMNVAQAALNGEAVPTMPADVKALSELVRQIVDQALEERDKHTDGQL